MQTFYVSVQDVMESNYVTISIIYDLVAVCLYIWFT